MTVLDSGSKIGFWTLISIVIGAQLGASIFLLPSELAAFRTLGLVGWIVAGVGAIFITTVFSFLCTKTAKTGGPHIYARMFFGEKVGFFMTWIYWCGAWACNPILIATAINYLMTLTGDLSEGTKLILEILLVLSLTFINTRGLKTSGYIEIFLTLLKIVPLVILPVISLSHMNFDNFSEITPQDMPPLSTITKATILSFWGFVGLEGGTSPAGMVQNPKRTIPLAIILGTTFVAIISVLNTVSIFGIIPPSELEHIGAPFSQALVILFGGSFDKLFGILTFIMCYGSLNAWVLFSGQIARTAAAENMMPKSFLKQNKNGAPSVALWTSSLGTIVVLFLQKSPLIGDKISKFLDMSVVIYIVLYTVAVFSYIRFLKSNRIKSFFQIFTTTIALLFCLFIIYNSDLSSFVALGLILISGVPVYLKLKRTNNGTMHV